MMPYEQSLAGKIKVALVISNLSFGGAERQVLELANNLDEEQFEVHLFIFSDHAPLADRLKNRNQRLHVISKRNKFDITVISRLAKAFRRLGIQVVHGFLYDAEIASRLAARLAGCTAIIGSERNTRNNNGGIKRAIYRYTSHLLDACIANSRTGAAFNRSVTGLPESTYHVVYNGVDTVRFSPRDGHALRAELGLTPSDTVVGMFGSFKHQKNHPLLLSAAHRLLAHRSDIRFVFVGTTLHEGYKTTNEYSNQVVKMVQDLNLQDACLFLGGQEQVEHYYNLCDITVLPSLFEGTPNVALESMASGVPVIATEVSDNAYVIPDGKAGYIVPLAAPEILADRIERLADDRELLHRMGRQARAWAENEFSLKKMSSNTGAVYLEVLRAKLGLMPLKQSG